MIKMGMFDGIMPGGEDNSPVSVLKDLQDPKNIQMKTDLNIRQIRVLVQLKLLYLLKDKSKTTKECIEETLKYYLELLVSVGRKSRVEIKEAIQNIKFQEPVNDLALKNLGK